ncbi:hypothetical protein ACKESD_16400 [Acinetobacter baumannii]|uniref:hypothetical protein n=1 Tax=Acinetobacter baumannii TaxID=470 RepID=UPI002AFCC18F|nr:hypothetical protein [Acinetobacter baumannii]
MNESQFVKVEGIKDARLVISEASETATHWDTATETYLDGYEGEELPNLFELAVLRRLVESIDTINEIGSLGAAKKKLRFASWEGSSEPDYVFTPLPQEEYRQLDQSIKDFESIYGASE